MSYEQQREQQNYGNTLRHEAHYVADMENSGNYMAARNRLAQDALSMGANSTVAGAAAFRHMTQEIRGMETGSVHVREFNTARNGDQVYVELDRPNGQPGGAVLVDRLATPYSNPQAQGYPPERYPATAPGAYPQADARAYPPQSYPPQNYPPQDAQGYPPQNYPPTGYDRTAYTYPPAQPAPVYDQPLPNQLGYPYATPGFAGVQPMIQANFGFGGGEPWRMREWQHEHEHRFMHPYYGGVSAGYYQPTPAYYAPAPSYYASAPGYYGNPAGNIIAGGLGGAVIGALAGGRRGAAIGGIAGAGLGAIFGG